MRKEALRLVGGVLIYLFVSSSPSQGTIHNVSIVDFGFTPPKTTVNPGDTVRWTNTGAFVHTSTSDLGFWNSGNLGPGGMFSRQFFSSGKNPYHCIPHLASMKDTIFVNNVPPTLSVPGSQSVNVNSPLSFSVSAADPNFSMTDPMALRENVTLTLDSVRPDPPVTNPTVGAGNPATFSWTPACTELGTYTAYFKASDGKGGLDFDSVVIQVNTTIHLDTITDVVYDAAPDTISPCDIMSWIYLSTLTAQIDSHTVTSDSSGLFNSGIMHPGDTFSYQFVNKGTFGYHCVVHGGETGAVKVGIDKRGDANGNGTINLADIIYLVNFVFKGGPIPNPLCVGDANNSGGNPNLADIIFLVNFVFKGGLAPNPPTC
ncbi:MAG: blue (type 1) copper protein [candidate division Zixibacteria bacterium RBG-1]|nr:MAG: blue (type 1) copper protein [candidate division Zixibacteria bacterium RBG-1]OGC83530.1 MAG: hypothetical protein A2V73_05905 [candidate division Zixibacteria bacterium RBG_19FT_COMBO_42_43]